MEKIQKEDEPVTQEEALELGALVTDEERTQISSESASLDEKVKNLRDLVDGKPAKILALNLAGDTLAELYLSVNASVGDLEGGICTVANIDAKEFMLSLTFEGAILDRRHKLREAGMLPEQAALVTAVKTPRPKRVKNPALDRALFQEAWMGGGNPDRVQALLDQNADPNGYTYSDGDRAIHVTAGRGYVEAVRLLLEARADIAVPGVGGLTPMQRCSQQSTTYWKGRYPEVQRLLRSHDPLGWDRKIPHLVLRIRAPKDEKICSNLKEHF